MIFPVPPPTLIPRPSVERIRRREAQIAAWEVQHWIRSISDEAEKRKTVFYRTAIALAVCLTVGLMVADQYLPAAAAVSLGMVAGWWNRKRPSPVPEGPKPEPLTVPPFTEWENQYLLSRQSTQEFLAVCSCPGCGLTEAHSMGKSPVQWGNTLRECRVCLRQWVQC